MKSLKGVSLAVAAAVAAILVPLYGDPRRAPVTHPEWAHMLVRALDMESVLAPGSSASLAFDSLSWRTSVSVAADKPFRSAGVEFLAGPPRAVRANPGSTGELGYRLAIGRPGDYHVRLKLAGARSADPTPGVALELTAEGETTPAKSLSLAPATLMDSGGVYLAQRIYTLSVGLPPGVPLEAIEVVPPCVNSIEPVGGWKPTAIAQTGDVAVTALKALDLESELPPAASPIDLPAMAFQPTSAQVVRASIKNRDLEGFWVEADGNGVQAVAQIDLPERGLYTVSGFGLAGGGQSWVADACRKAVICPATEKPETPRWRPIMTAEFSAGRHSFAVTLIYGAALQRLRFERKKESVADYLGTLTRLGLDLGEERPIPRNLALDAMKFVQGKRRAALDKCGDVFMPSGALVAGLAFPPGATITTGTASQPAPGAGPGGGPVIPLPGPSAPGPNPPPPIPGTSPSPGVSPSPGPSPSPAASPSVGPPPTTVPQQPASPVKD